MSWTGSENERQEQGICRPPLKEPTGISRYTVLAGTSVHIVKLRGGSAQSHVTRTELRFDRSERSKFHPATFRHEGYLITVPWRKVIDANGR